MNDKRKTIGPFCRDCNGIMWVTMRYQYHQVLCIETVDQYLNIPHTATKLWVTLTKCRPIHNDALRVQLSRTGYVRLDGSRRQHFVLHYTRTVATGFGKCFYATFYWE